MVESIIILLIALVISLTIHEFAHAAMATYLGDQTAKREGRLTLNPIPHIDPIMTVLLPLALIVAGSPVVLGAARPVPYKPWALRYGRYGSALVAAAGPFSNLLLAILFAVLLQILQPTQFVTELLVRLVVMNIGLMVFNLIPVPPLDGSRILYAFSPLSLRNALDSLEQYGFIIIFGLLLLGGAIINPILGGIIGAIVQVLIPGLTRI